MFYYALKHSIEIFQFLQVQGFASHFNNNEKIVYQNQMEAKLEKNVNHANFLDAIWWCVAGETINHDLIEIFKQMNWDKVIEEEKTIY